MPASAPTPLPPGAIDTIIAQTAQAAATQTAALIPPTLTPTFTPLPTRTASATPSPTPTFRFFIATLTRAPATPTLGTPTKDFACALTDQSPADGSSVRRNQSFSVTWTVQNTGMSSWDANNVDFVFSSGTKMTSVRGVDLPKSVAAGEVIALKITMEAPGAPDTYKTVWTLQSGKDTFCRLDLTVVVTK